MQTFLPYPSYTHSARVLDRLRLGKQRVEVLQLLNALLDGGGWANHPATKMWESYELALCAYGVAICEEWRSRGYNDSCLQKILDQAKRLHNKKYVAPPWLGNKDFHASHRSNLLRKDHKYYSQFNWKEPDNLEYIWPTQEESQLNGNAKILTA